jgi:hypothetical protein
MIQILELFGGIGSPRCALRNIFESIFRKMILGETSANKRKAQLSLF